MIERIVVFKDSFDKQLFTYADGHSICLKVITGDSSFRGLSGYIFSIAICTAMDKLTNARLTINPNTKKRK